MFARIFNSSYSKLQIFSRFVWSLTLTCFLYESQHNIFLTGSWLTYNWQTCWDMAMTDLPFCDPTLIISYKRVCCIVYCSIVTKMVSRLKANSHSHISIIPQNTPFVHIDFVPIFNEQLLDYKNRVPKGLYPQIIVLAKSRFPEFTTWLCFSVLRFTCCFFSSLSPLLYGTSLRLLFLCLLKIALHRDIFGLWKIHALETLYIRRGVLFLAA